MNRLLNVVAVLALACTEGLALDAAKPGVPAVKWLASAGRLTCAERSATGWGTYLYAVRPEPTTWEEFEQTYPLTPRRIWRSGIVRIGAASRQPYIAPYAAPPRLRNPFDYPEIIELGIRLLQTEISQSEYSAAPEAYPINAERLSILKDRLRHFNKMLFEIKSLRDRYDQQQAAYAPVWPQWRRSNDLAAK